MSRHAALSYCPSCGQPRFHRSSPKSHCCAACGFTLYLNASVAVAALLVRGSDVLMTVRAHAPARGKLDLPGGFVDNHETAEQALEREVSEELGVRIRAYEYLCSFPNIYPFEGMHYHVLDLFYIVDVDAHGLGPLTMGPELAGCCWLDIASIPLEDIAFPSTRNALQRYRRGKRWIRE